MGRTWRSLNCGVCNALCLVPVPVFHLCLCVLHASEDITEAHTCAFFALLDPAFAVNRNNECRKDKRAGIQVGCPNPFRMLCVVPALIYFPAGCARPGK